MGIHQAVVTPFRFLSLLLRFYYYFLGRVRFLASVFCILIQFVAIPDECDNNGVAGPGGACSNGVAGPGDSEWPVFCVGIAPLSMKLKPDHDRL